MAETLFALTSDDAGGGGDELARFREWLDFLAAQQVPATFFVTPAAGGVPLAKKPGWLALLQRAREEGHELQLHGLDHGDVFEFGVPGDYMLDIIPEARDRWQREPQAIRAGHTLALLGDRLARAKEAFSRALDCTPQGFRAPCLAMCDNTYLALARHGFRWSSNLVVNPKGWRYINRQYDDGDLWRQDVPPRPFRHRAGIVEVPILSEYTWYLGEEDLERHARLIEGDLDRVRRAGGAFVPLSHYFALTGEWAAGLRVYERLIARAREQGAVRFCTVSQLVDRFCGPREDTAAGSDG